MASYRRSRLPFARPQTLQTLQNPPNLQKSGELRRKKVPQQAQHAPLPHAKATTRPQAMAQEHPTAAAMASYRRSRLPVCQASNPPYPPKPSKPSKSPASSAGNRYPNKPNMRHFRTQKPPQGHSNGSRAPHGRSNGFFIGVQCCRLPGLNPPNPPPNMPHSRTQKPPQGHSNGSGAPHGRSNGFFYRRSRLPFARPQTLQTLQKSGPAPQGKGTPTSPTRGTAARKKPPQGHSNGSRAPHGRSNGFLYAFKAAAAAMASYRRSRLPFARPQTLQTLQNPPNPPKTLQTLQKSGQLRREKVPQQAQHAPLPHAKATTRPQQWLKGTPRPQQWLLIRVQGCRLPGLKPSKPSKTLQTLQKSGQLRREKVPQQAQHAPLPHAKATTRPQQRLKSTPRPQQWLLIGVKTLQTFQLLQKSAQLRCKRYANRRHARTQKRRQGHRLEKQTAICLSCCPSPSLSLQYPPSN